ncbi:MAG: hypothetical protein RI885_908 [Actinomycetota bacterium]|jgi:NADPH-dependent ferric siderophore reductase
MTTHDPEHPTEGAFAPGGGQRVLLIGDETTAGALCSLVGSLTVDTRGQAFVETDEVGLLPPPATPRNVVVTWLTRDARSAQRRSERLERALVAWVGEMVVEQSDADAIYCWIDLDPALAARVTAIVERAGIRIASAGVQRSAAGTAPRAAR